MDWHSHYNRSNWEVHAPHLKMLNSTKSMRLELKRFYLINFDVVLQTRNHICYLQPKSRNDVMKGWYLECFRLVQYLQLNFVRARFYPCNMSNHTAQYSTDHGYSYGYTKYAWNLAKMLKDKKENCQNKGEVFSNFKKFGKF